MEVSSKMFKAILIGVADEIKRNVSCLTELDAEIGDGDHGVNMDKGFSKIKEVLLNFETDDIGEILNASGKVLLNEIGGAMGPLYGGGFVNASIALKGKNSLNKNDIYILFNSMLELINEIAPAKVGDKTLVDTLEPFVNEYKNLMQCNNLVVTFEGALKKAKEGMESTKDLISKVGRSSRLFERSKGHIDAGAFSCYLILKTFYNFIYKMKG